MKKMHFFRKQIIALFLFVALFVLVFSIGLSAKAATIQVKGVDIIYTNPGEDCSTEVTISWHAQSRRSEIIYTEKLDANYERATKKTVLGTFDDTSFIYYDKASFYKCSITLKDLMPDTEYIYKVSCDDIVSAEHTFKTAGASEYTFGYMSDIHAVPYDNVGKTKDGTIQGLTAVKKMQTVQALLDQAKAINNNLAFVITTGDEVWRGSQYSNWQEWSKTQYTTALNDYLWLSCPGNHEYYTQVTDSVWNYYPDKYSANPSQIYSDKDYFYNTYFNAVKSVPKNGPEGVPSSYYTLYNNILFICIDSMQSSEYGKLNELKAWFGEVVEANEGNYQYIIAYQHYPWYDFETGADKYAYRWKDVFDKYGVDLALSGHMHGYLRTKSLYDGKICTEDGKGTVYVVSPQVGDRPKSVTGHENESLMAFRESTLTWPNYSAMSAITVTSEGLTYRLIDMEGNVHDQFEVKARRGVSITQKSKQSIEDTLTFSSSADAITCDMKNSLNIYVDEMKVEVDGKTAIVKPATDKTSFATVSGLSSNRLYNAKVTVKFIDGSTYTKEERLLTTDAYGIVDLVKATSVDGKMRLSWLMTTSAISVEEYKIYLNDTLLTTLSTTSSSYDIDMSQVNYGSKYTLEGYKSGVMVYHKDFYYNVYGDVNLDGLVDNNDAKDLINKILSGYQFDEYAVALLDNNGDGIIDIGDAFKILAYNEKKINNVITKEFEVIFLGANNEIIAKSKVAEGENVTPPAAPTLEGYTFVGWNASLNNITHDVIIRAVYKAE